MSRTEFVFAVLVLVLALTANGMLCRIGLHHTVLGDHSFRQAQTGITIAEFLKDGPRLAYRTPILGPPWELPLEFPLYQAVVAWTVRATGADIDFAGRIISWLFFLSALTALYMLLGSAGLRRSSRLLCLAVVLTCPIYIYFSRCVLIESTALSLSTWFVAAFLRWRTGGRAGWLTTAWTCGALAGAVKLTTFFGFAFAAGVLTCADLWRRRGPDRLRVLRQDVLAIAVPLVATIAWTMYALAVRQHNPEAEFLKTSFGSWTFGSFGLRFSAAFWAKTAWVVGVSLSEAGAVALLAYLLGRRGPHRAIAALGVLTYLVTILVFSNLYWIHDYYHYANAFFLVVALGIAVVELGDAFALSGSARAVLVLAVCACQLACYRGSYWKNQRVNTPVPELASVLSQVVDPDQMAVILGEDWDASIPYYSKTRALMLIAGRERDPEGIVRSMSRLDPKQVAAIVLHGGFWHDPKIAQLFSRFDIGSRPFLSNGQDISIWVPRAAEPKLRDRVDLRRTPTFHVGIPEQAKPGEAAPLTAGMIARRDEFSGFVPLPVRALSPHDFAAAEVNGQKVLVAHAVSEFVFQIPAGKHSVTGVYGMFDGSWNNGQGTTDGVEFVIVERTTDGKEQDLFRRFVQPQAFQQDRGSQPLDLDVETHGGEIIFRTLPGPKNNISFDWAYWGHIQIR